MADHVLRANRVLWSWPGDLTLHRKTRAAIRREVDEATLRYGCTNNGPGSLQLTRRFREVISWEISDQNDRRFIEIQATVSI